MKIFIWLVLLAAVVCTFPLSAAAFTLPLGTHKLEWVMPSVGDKTAEGSSIRQWGWSLSPLDRSAKVSVEGARSSKVMTSWILGGRCVVAVLDESKGTGTGYDSLYLVPFDVTKSKVIDISTARKINVVTKDTISQNSEWTGSVGKLLHLTMTDDPKDVVIDHPFGEGANEMTKPVGVDSVSLYIPDGEGSVFWDEHMRSNIEFRGKWTATVTTDEGSFTLTPVDRTGAGIFNQYATRKTLAGDEYHSGNQVLYLRFAGEEHGSYQFSMDAGRPTLVEGELYVADLNDVGDQVRIKRYDGDVANVIVKAVDGFGKPIAVSGASVTGPFGQYSVNDREATKVPAGDYSYSVSVAEPGTRTNCTVQVSSVSKMKLAKGEATTITVGGSVRVVAAPADKEISYVTGSNKKVDLVPLMDDPDVKPNFWGPEDKLKVALTIKDSKGAVVWTGLPLRNAGRWDIALDMPKTLPVGAYKLIITADIDQYQKTVTTEKNVVVKPLTGSGPMALPAGTFKGKWVERAQGDPSAFQFPVYIRLREMSITEMAWLTGKKFNHPVIGVLGRITIIVDSSKPGSNTYDTAYLMSDLPKRGVVDLSKAAMTVPSKGSDFIAFYNQSVPWTPVTFNDVDVKMGAGSGRDEAARNTRYRLSLWMPNGKDSATYPVYASLEARAFWQYLISTDSGDVTINLLDANANGRFDDIPDPYDRSGDGIEIRDCFDPHENWPTPHYQLLSRRLCFRGKYYEVTTDRSGDTMKIRPYTGPMGKLFVKAVGAKGEDIPLTVNEIFCGDASHVPDYAKGPMDLPAAPYMCRATSSLRLSQPGDIRDNIWYQIKSHEKIYVEEGKTAVWTVKGPMNINIETGPALFGKSLSVRVRATIGEDAASIVGDLPFKVTDSGGNTIAEGYMQTTTLDREQNPDPCTILDPEDFPDIYYRLDMSWKNMRPGEYKLVVTVDTKEFQGVVCAEKKFSIAR